MKQKEISTNKDEKVIKEFGEEWAKYNYTNHDKEK